MVFDCILISIPSMLVEPLVMSCAEAAYALAPWALDLKPVDFSEYLALDIQDESSSASLSFPWEPGQTWTG